MQRRVTRGFTLLELLIVLVIMAVMVSIASVSFRSFETDPVETALKRLRFDVTVLSNEAIVRSEPLALGFTETGYHFFKLDDKNKWVEIENDSLFTAREYTDKSLKAQVIVDKEPVSLLADLSTEPQIIVEPTGELTPFIYELAAGKNDPQQVQFDALGQVIEKNPEDDAKS
ncbi:MAG TPA: type II secretion system minor pseudopilin GspH [Thiolinea sp.]|nr:type II secretion system minor pseudopilin GspH [Thiolinea sp.]